ncbi:hypothetical protein BSKO_01642 [Bryopsis sp. KO-2023]|nr:hypothetical protein BSKO_01642 [Bryopsis sp. KO-2023]
MGKKRGAVDKGGGFRSKRPRSTFKRPFEKSKQGQIPFPPEQNRDVEIDEDDMEFVAEYGKNLDFLNNIDGGKLDDGVLKKEKPKVKGPQASDRNAEGADSDNDSDNQVPFYERVPRGRKAEDSDEMPKPAAEEDADLLLPIKTPSGDVVFKQEEASLSRKTAHEMAGRVEGIVIEDMAEVNAAPPKDDTEGADDGARGAEVDRVESGLIIEEEVEEEEEEEGVEQGIEEEPAQTSLMDLEDGQTLEERRQELREQMAASASRVIKNPEENIGEMKSILAMVKDGDSQIQRLAMVSLLAIFKDICPGYRIRLPTEKEKSVKVSKEVARLRAYEAFLLRCYQVFLKQLIGFQQRKGDSGSALARVAVRCAGGLLASLNHFNYSSDLLQAVVPHMCDSDTSIRRICSDAVAKSIEADTEGKIAVEAVQLVGDLVKRRKCQCPPEVLHSLMGLTFPDINLANNDDEDLKKQKKKKKKSKKGDDVEKTFKAADGDPDRERKAALQSQTVEALFEIFFRVLKDCARVTRQRGATTGSLSSGDLQERCPMLYQSLRGLSKFAHVLSVEYFQDLLEVFRQLLASPALPCLERLCCLLTTSDILHGQGEALNVDRRDYYQQLYWSLKHWDPYLCTDDSIDEPNGSNNADHHGWSWEHKRALESIEELEDLLVEVINQMLCESKARDYVRLAAFLKRLLWLGLHQGCSVLMGIQSVVNRLLLRHHRLRSLLDGDGGAPAGGKGYNPQIDDPGEASALSTTLWELTILAKHFHPHVSQGATDLANIPVDSGRSSADIISSVLSAMDGPSALVNRYNTSRGTFWPVPKVPKKLSKSARKSFAMSETEHFTDLQESCVEAVDDEVLEVSLKKYFRESSRFQRNSNLRRELAVVKAQAEKFKEHLSAKKAKGKKPRNTKKRK